MTHPLPWFRWSTLALSLAASLSCAPVEEVEQPPLTPVSQKQGVEVPGFAELHHHMFAEEAFGGGWFHGGVNGSLDTCDGGFPESDHARVRMDLSGLLNLCPNSGGVDLSNVPVLSQFFGVAGAVASEFLGKIEGTEGDTGLHLGRRHPGSEWPRWDTIAHQQSWGGWLKQAHQGGLSLVVVSAVSNGFLCEALPPQNRIRPCDEMTDVEVQLQRARAFDTANDWAEIALSPADARRIITQGRLAMVLSIETSKLFGTKDWRTELERFHALGVRTLQPVHQLDNRFGGAAPHNAIFQAAQFLENCHIDTDCGLTVGGLTLGFDVDSQCRNVRGLTPDGQQLLQAMMDKGMLIDLAHVSEKGVRDAYAVAEQNRYYPLYISHGHFREVMNGKLAEHEKTTPAWVVQMLRRTGGMFGLRTAHDETRTYTPANIANDCQGSSRSFAQAYEFGRQGLKVNMGFGADLNGFIQQTRPRFGPHGACSAGFKAEADAQAHQQELKSPGRLGTPFDERGLAHVGLLPDLLQDVTNLGADTTPLARSAELFIQMWERTASSARTGMADAATDIDTSGVLPWVPRADRERGYSTVCGKPYAPDSRTLGQTCKSDNECTTDRCSADCYVNPTGSCLCDSDSHCGSGQFCGWGTNTGKCMNKRSRGAVCSSDRECASGTCRWSFTCK